MPHVGPDTNDWKLRKPAAVKPISYPMQSRLRSIARSSMLAVAISLLSMTAAVTEAQQFIPNVIISSTTPANGDLNPYGVAFVPPAFPSGGKISPGDILISNFNDKTNTQGTGTTIIKLTPNGLVAAPPAPGTTAGSATTFFTSSAIGLTTALGVLSRGFVVVGNLPNSPVGTLSAGSLQVIDRSGKLVQTITDPLIDGPWDLTIDDHNDNATLFVSNVLNGTVIRLNLTISPSAVTASKPTVTAKGYTVQPNTTAPF